MSIRSYGEPWKDDLKQYTVSSSFAAAERAKAIAAAERAVIEAAKEWRANRTTRTASHLAVTIDSLLAITHAQGGGAK